MEQLSSSHQFLWWFSIALCVFSLLFLVFLFFRHKKTAIETKFKLQLLAGAAVLPLLTLYFSNNALLESMKEDQFCGSCHTMTPFIQSLKASEETSLAAKHAQHNWIREKRCYTCHTDYQILGGVKSKIRGLRHLYAFYSGHADRRPKLYKPYQNSQCLSCHRGVASYEEVAIHKEMSDGLVKNEISCLNCHGPAHPQ